MIFRHGNFTNLPTKFTEIYKTVAVCFWSYKEAISVALNLSICVHGLVIQELKAYFLDYQPVYFYRIYDYLASACSSFVP